MRQDPVRIDAVTSLTPPPDSTRPTVLSRRFRFDTGNQPRALSATCEFMGYQGLRPWLVGVGAIGYTERFLPAEVAELAELADAQGVVPPAVEIQRRLS